VTVTVLRGNALHLPLADESVHCVVTSPPYWALRDYGVPGQLGLEPTPDEYVANMVAVFREVWRVLRPDGTVWLNLGDSYAGSMKGIGADGRAYAGEKQATNRGSVGIYDGRPPTASAIGLKPKDLCGIPWRVAFALQADGWWLRSDIIWAKGVSFCESYAGSCMPESVTDRPTSAHEHVFLLAKSARYFYDNEAVKEPCGDSMLSAASRSPRDDRQYKHDTETRMGKRSGNRVFSDVDSMARIAASGRNLRNVWAINPAGFPGAHFATFPPALVEPCIKAGTSERGCCPKCGAPWERVVEKSGGTIGHSWHDHGADSEKGMSQYDPRYQAGGVGSAKDANGQPYRVSTLGWQSTCGCREEPVPCVVLDPFGGAGTTMLVADRLGRHGVGVELSGEYCRMARQRCYEDAPLLAYAQAMEALL
jgi:DNA modification methylase